MINNEKNKICCYCKSEKDRSLFYKNKTRPDGFSNYCKDCSLIRRRINRSGRKTKLMKNFNLTLEQYDLMYSEQNGVCAICGHAETAKYNGTTRGLSVDHCHSTGKVRGLLCFACNIALGKFKDNINNLTKAIAYLKK